MRLTWILALMLVGCAAGPGEEVPEFTIASETLFEARKAFRDSDGEILFLMMVNESGEVVRSRVLETNMHDDVTVARFHRHMRTVKFDPATEQDPRYRQFLYPMDVQTTLSH